jgi:signal transduction histidine kinase
MDAFVRTLADPVTYRRLLYLLLGVPLGTVWFVALVTIWSLCFGLVITPLVIPALFALAYLTRGFAAVEAEIARSLLDVDLRPPVRAQPGDRLRARVRALFGGDFWRAQAYLWLRWFAGFPAGIAIFSLVGGSLALIVAPLWVPSVPSGMELGFWNPHTVAQCLVLVPVGLAVLPLSIALAKPLGAAFRPVAVALLQPAGAQPEPRFAQSLSGSAHAVAVRRPLNAHAAADAGLVALTIAIWAITSRGYFWPEWIALPLASVLAIHAWFVELATRAGLVAGFRGSEFLAQTIGVGAVAWLFTFMVWLMTGHGYFWPIWTLLGLGAIVAAGVATVLLGSPGDAEMAERIEQLQSTRAGAVSVQDSELRRIERDLHDGAQARLVALGMSLGMAEQKLADDPERAGELLAEARAGAEQALRELRDLARGIHPPVLADRGLEAALQALANATPLHVSLAVDVRQRPAPPVESAAYFVAAEALANAGKHAHADWVDIRIARVGPRLEVEIRDDGQGGADASGGGLTGLRRRVEALDGTLQVFSPPGGPTTVYAELPCA